MILILSEHNEPSTNRVIDWLDFLGKKYFRINKEDSVELVFIGDDIRIKVNKNNFKLSEITGFWYRRGYIAIKNNFRTNIKQFDELQNEEMLSLIQFIYYKLNKLKHLNSISTTNINKLIVSDLARELDILTPNDFVFSSAKELKKTKNNYITKEINGGALHKFENFTIYNYTKEINFDNLPSNFFPSLVQNKIEKKYELRIFYLDGKFYSMAIFSQNNSQSIIDSRNYSKPIRNVPYKLPNQIEHKLDLLMQKLNLNSGSIDMIMTPNNEYVFLEVNPVGQFSMVSYPCNYNLERKIANYF
jgi:ATP-GRASP peptide maturase of grasp-with-spasm system